MKKESTALTTVTSLAPQYETFHEDGEEIRELVEEYFRDGINETDLHLIKVPKAPSKTWDLPGEVSARTFTGVILGVREHRQLWKNPFEQNDGEAPVCKSLDGIMGVGIPGGACAICPKAEWGSGKDGEGTACPPRTTFYVLMPGDTLPVRLDMPVGATKQLPTLNRDLLNARAFKADVVITFGLSEVPRGKKKSGTYNQVTFTIVERFDDATKLRSRAYAASLTATLGLKGAVKKQGAIAVRSDLDEDGPPADMDDIDWGSGAVEVQDAGDR